MNKAPQSIEDFSIPKDVIAKLLEQEPQVSVLTAFWCAASPGVQAGEDVN